MGLACIVSGAVRIHEDMFLAAGTKFPYIYGLKVDLIKFSKSPPPYHFPPLAEALASQVTDEHRAQGLVYPPFKGIRKISAQLAADVAAMAYEMGEGQIPLFIHIETLFVSIVLL